MKIMVKVNGEPVSINNLTDEQYERVRQRLLDVFKPREHLEVELDVELPTKRIAAPEVGTKTDVDVKNRKDSYPIKMNVQEVAEVLRVHVSTVYELVTSGALPARKLGGTIRIDRDQLFEQL